MAPLSTPCREVRRSVANGLETAKFEAMRGAQMSQVVATRWQKVRSARHSNLCRKLGLVVVF